MTTHTFYSQNYTREWKPWLAVCLHDVSTWKTSSEIDWNSSNAVHLNVFFIPFTSAEFFTFLAKLIKHRKSAQLRFPQYQTLG